MRKKKGPSSAISLHHKQRTALIFSLRWISNAQLDNELLKHALDILKDNKINIIDYKHQIEQHQEGRWGKNKKDFWNKRHRLHWRLMNMLTSYHRTWRKVNRKLVFLTEHYKLELQVQWRGSDQFAGLNIKNSVKPRKLINVSLSLPLTHKNQINLI